MLNVMPGDIMVYTPSGRGSVYHTLFEVVLKIDKTHLHVLQCYKIRYDGKLVQVYYKRSLKHYEDEYTEWKKL